MVAKSKGHLVLVRHGESEGNRNRIFTIAPSVLLTKRGRQQARRAADLIAQSFAVRRIVSSPYLRAWQTAEILAEVLRAPLALDEAFREQDLGRLAGRPYEAVLEDPAFEFARRWEWRPPGGESLVDVRARVAGAFDRLAAEHPGEDVVLVSHGGVLLALWAYVVGSWEEAQPVGNGGIVVIEHRAGKYSWPRLLESGTHSATPATLARGSGGSSSAPAIP